MSNYSHIYLYRGQNIENSSQYNAVQYSLKIGLNQSLFYCGNHDKKFLQTILWILVFL